jgi:phospholipid/cholesterol/gamma-HCH transport system permease protein
MKEAFFSLRDIRRMTHSGFLHAALQGNTLQLHLQDAWVLGNIDAVSSAWENASKQLHASALSQIELHGQKLEALDTAGAWVLSQLLQQLRERSPQLQVDFVQMPPHSHSMMQTVLENTQKKKPEKKAPTSLFYSIGKALSEALKEGYLLFGFLGQTFITLMHCLRRPRRLRFASIVRHIDEAGIDAIPIIALIAFLISIVLAYQGIQQLRQFGAEIFTINMVAISVLREMGVLLTAIMIAGRSGSAFTAEIGVMQVNEEVDAMRVIGLSPFEVLVLPRFLALVIALPLLTFIADMMGLVGGAIVSYFAMDITLTQFIQQFQTAVRISDFWVGIVKAPVFALIISVVGCFKGMQVHGSAESVGRMTTSSVVASIFIVLLADALFAIFFTKLGI